MIIKKVAFGNEKEGFIEDKFKDGVNIIYSSDNNKGKTLVMQGLMYAIGNDPIFPTGFNSKDYYFYTKFEHKGKEYEFLRKRDLFIVSSESIYQICEGQTELKLFINKNLFELPVIEKNDETKRIDLSLFYQMFFVGQDKRNPSNLFPNSYYNKADFVNMLSSFNGYLVTSKNIEEIGDIRDKIKELKADIKSTEKLIRFAQDNPVLNDFVNEYVDNDNFVSKKKKISELVSRISGFKRKRILETNRVSKLKYLIMELNSLNRNMNSGKVICGDCESENILYVNSSVSFDVSNIDVRNKILLSIEESILLKVELIKEYTSSIHWEQSKLKDELREVPIELQKLLIHSEEILTSVEYSNKVFELQKELEYYNELKEKKNFMDEEAKNKKKQMESELVILMNSYYSKLTTESNIEYKSLFTKNDETYSGSEEQEFYFCKLMAINEYFDHMFPLIVDSFRDGELSSRREKQMLEQYLKINNQVILTATLKDEEYDKDKYQKIEKVNAIDYSSFADSKILSKEYAQNLRKILEQLKVKI